MSRPIQIVLIGAILTTFLWSGTFVHDFCESLSAGNIDGHHCHHLFSISNKPAAAKISLPIVQAEEHAHQPSMGGNHKSGKVFEAQTGANPSEYALSRNFVYHHSSVLTLHSRQRPPPWTGHYRKVPIFIIYQALLS